MLTCILVTVMNMGVQIYLQQGDFIPFGYVLSSEIVKLYDNSTFKFLRIFQKIHFKNDCTSSHSCQKGTYFLLSISLPTLLIVPPFENNHAHRCEFICHCSFLFIYSYVYKFGSFLPPARHPFHLPTILQTSRQNLVCPFLQFC
jgi:hypothetical protein